MLQNNRDGGVGSLFQEADIHERVQRPWQDVTDAHGQLYCDARVKCVTPLRTAMAGGVTAALFASFGLFIYPALIPSPTR